MPNPSAVPSRFQQSAIIVALCIVTIGLFHLFTLRDGHIIGDDFAMYILHAKNIAEGRPYGMTGYIYNPANPDLGPPVYPPVTPVLLAPVYYFAGVSLRWMKAEMVLVFLLALVMAYKIARRFLPWQWALALTLVLGCCPLFSESKEIIGSDLPFFFIALLCLYAADRFFSESRGLPYFIGLGVLVYLAYATRSVGLVLIPTLLFYGILRHKTGAAVVACLTTVALIVIHGLVFPQGEASMLKLFDRSLISSAKRCILYLRTFRELWLNGFSNTASILVFGASLLLFALGLRAIRKQLPTVYDIFAILYLGLISIFADHVPRYIFPLIPFYLLYVFLGLYELKTLLPRQYKLIAALAMLVVVVSYTGQYVKKDWGPFKVGLSDPEYQDACQFITSHTDKNARFISSKPRLLALVTGRSAAVYGRLNDLPAYMDQIGAKFVIAHIGAASDDLALFCAEHSAAFPVLYKNGSFVLYGYQTDVR